MSDHLQLPDLLRCLDANQLRRRLDELDGERAAIIVLLRAARARQRSQPRGRTRATPACEDRHAT
jgi:hypothetical protein